MQTEQLTRRSTLVRYLTLTYLVLVVYTSLYPFSEWRAPAEEVRVFLTAPWPRYFTWADLLLNVAAYFPLGVLLTLVLMSRLRANVAMVTAMLLVAATSLLIEVAQVYLPGRIPSNTDLLCNAIGGFLGAGVARLAGGRQLVLNRLYRMRDTQFQPGAVVDICFVLLALWLATQFNAEIRLFGNGDIRHLLPSVPEVRYTPNAYVLSEAAITALNFCGVALMLTAISSSRRAAVVAVIVLMLGAAALKSLAASVLFETGEATLWLTPAATWGVLGGAALWLALLAAPRSLEIVGATMSIALGMALVNAAPNNPYLDASLRVWRYGHYASLNELTGVISGLWPVAAIGFLTFLGHRLR